MISQNRRQDIDRRAAENNYRMVKANLEIELLHQKIDQLREREILKLTEVIRMLTELLEQSASDTRERTTVITRDYRLHGMMLFSIRRAKLHALAVPCSSGAEPLSVLRGTTLLSRADEGKPLWSLAVS
ncbi:hypothetical protein CDS [Bradyrhizobium sp.]|nr:hypothetical protein CDS [Bradyrhizobium sp.]